MRGATLVRLTRLRMIRQRAALSQRELGEKSGVSYVQISRIENGEVEPHPSTIRRLAAALNVEPHELMEPEAGSA